ncbi:uncharacterized protein LOC132711215 [Pantherophis guttatus]|uniref:Uncharacterized protein LOC132711215 n=1 Tax=Pantherophis guttatus TaxID=94885 RepID=A0ABM3ZB05_PANGU|nr:uncharacterized protein LOC132711215 [Pantherophis guttatus]
MMIGREPGELGEEKGRKLSASESRPQPLAHLGGDCAVSRPGDLRAKPCTQLECDAGKRGGHSGLLLSAASPDPPVKRRQRQQQQQQQQRRRGGREQAEAEGAAAAAAANPSERFEYRFRLLVWSPLGFLLPGTTPGFQTPPGCCGAGRCFPPTGAIGDPRPSPGSSEGLCPPPPTEAVAAGIRTAPSPTSPPKVPHPPDSAGRKSSQLLRKREKRDSPSETTGAGHRNDFGMLVGLPWTRIPSIGLSGFSPDLTTSSSSSSSSSSHVLSVCLKCFLLAALYQHGI